MFGYNDISIDFLTGSGLVLALAVVLMVLLVIYLYKRTNPPLPLYLRIVMAALRTVAVFALLLALAEPVISYARHYERERRITVLIDVSGSMDRVESGKTRNERLDSLLESGDYGRLAGNARVATFYFGGTTGESPDEVASDHTALGDALELIGARQISQPPDYWLLLSDGRSNSGKDVRKVAARVTQPVIAVDISSDTGTFDVSVDEIDYNPVLFVGQRTEIKARLKWHDATGRNVSVQLLDSNRVAAQTNYSLDQREGFSEITLSYLPASPGQRILTLNALAGADEETSGNNQRSFSVKVLKSRLLVLLVTQAPDYEVGFLKRLLDQSDKYEVDLVVNGPGAGNLSGRFPSGQTELNRYDLVVLYDPDPRRLESAGDLLTSYLSDRGGAVWVMMGQQFSQAGPVRWFNELMPFYQSRHDRIDYVTFHGEPSESQLFHPAVRLDDTPAAIREVWSQLPPFRALVKCSAINPEATVLAYASLPASEEIRYPVLGYLRFGPGKLMASAALPFWTWGFVSLGFNEDHLNYSEFVEGTVSWLTVTDDLEPVRAGPEKHVFHRGETIRFDGFAYDLGYRPIPGVTGTVSLHSPEDERNYETDFIAAGDGVYKAWFHNVAPGSYRYRARLEKEGGLLKEATGSVLVESFSLEQLDQSGDPATLAAIAGASGGSYYTYEQFDRAVNALDLAPAIVEQKGELSLLNKPLLLVIFLIAVCVEWLLRKINQLL